MKTRETFGLAVKIIGFLVLLQGLRNIVESLMLLKGYAHVRLSTPTYWGVWGVIKIATGLYLMMTETLFVDLAFFRKPATQESSGEADAEIDRSKLDKHEGQLMDPKVAFGIIVRGVGLILFLYGLEYLLDDLLFKMKTPDVSAPPHQQWSAFGLIESLAGLAIMRGILPLANWAFPNPKSERGAETKGPLV